MHHSHSHNETPIEKVGFYLSVICAIHCIATPVVMTVLPYLGSSLFHNHSWEIWFIGASVALAGALLIADYRKHHSIVPLTLLLGSLAVKGIELVWTGEQYEFLTGFVGAILIASAYYFNWKAKASCSC